MANYVCKKMCFTDRRIYPGDVVTESMAALAPNCFAKLKSTKPTSMEKEVEELVPEVAERNKNRITPMTMTDLHKASLPPIAGVDGAALPPIAGLETEE